MIQKLTAEELNLMNIWQIRDYARKCGHPSPTSTVKAKLIEFIMEVYKKTEGEYLHEEENITYADQVTHPEKKKRGRPPKRLILFTPPATEVLDKQDANNDMPQRQDFVQPDDYQQRRPFDYRNNNGQRKPFMHDQSRPFFGGNGYNNNANNGVVNNSANNLNNNTNSNNNSNVAGNVNPENAVDATPQPEEIGIREGVLELCPDGYGFLRAKNYEQGEGDAYVAVQRIRKSGLRRGDYVVANVKKLAENRPWSVTDIISVNGRAPETAFQRPSFDNLTPIYPDSRIKLELPSDEKDFAIRAIDLVAPIGKGQRAMIVSPPKAGKTTLLKKIANSISTNYPEAHLMVLLIDERPEEVTDMQRSIKGEVIYSTFDEMPEHHTHAAEMVLERAKRLVEYGKDVIILMDSLTRLARAYNLVITPTGKTLSGGIDPGALHNPKRFFGAARNIEFGGSLTIIATALVDTGSRMDDVIYEEFKGTGNMEIHLDRRLSEKRIFPAIDLNRSGTRREELLLNAKELEGIWSVRKFLSAGDVQEATENLMNMMMKTDNNKEFIEQLGIQISKLQKEGYKVFN